MAAGRDCTKVQACPEKHCQCEPLGCKADIPIQLIRGQGKFLNIIREYRNGQPQIGSNSFGIRSVLLTETDLPPVAWNWRQPGRSSFYIYIRDPAHLEIAEQHSPVGGVMLVGTVNQLENEERV